MIMKAGIEKLSARTIPLLLFAAFFQAGCSHPVSTSAEFDYLFDNAIVYFDRQFANAYDELGFETQDSLYNTARVLDGLIGYYIRQHLSPKAMKRDLRMETEFGEEVCEYLVRKISENYHTLQMNTLMDMIRVDNPS